MQLEHRETGTALAETGGQSAEAAVGDLRVAQEAGNNRESSKRQESNLDKTRKRTDC